MGVSVWGCCLCWCTRAWHASLFSPDMFVDKVKKLEPPWTFVSIKFDRVSISSRNGERKEIIRLDCLSCTDSPQKHSVCVNLNSLSLESCNYFQKLHFKLAQKDLSESLNAHVFSWCIFNVLKKCHFVLCTCNLISKIGIFVHVVVTSLIIVVLVMPSTNKPYWFSDWHVNIAVYVNIIYWNVQILTI